MPASIGPLPPATVIVSVWVALTAFVAVPGVMLMLASTHVLLALPEPPAFVFTAVLVVRVIVWPLTVSVERRLDDRGRAPPT